MENSLIRSGFGFGNWEVLPKIGMLSGPDKVVHLAPELMEILVLLARNARDVVSHQQIMGEIWPGESIDKSKVTRHISQLCNHLGDDPHQPEIIETIPDKGYRFMLAVTIFEDSQTLQAPVEHTSRAVVSHFRIQEQLGRGGMGVVYRAEDMKLKRTVALKFLPMEWTGNDESRERFKREARAASALDHPNICTVYEIDETSSGKLFIAMAYYKGETLKEKIANGPVDLEESLNIVVQVAEGLRQAHEAGIIHRDIKPANILLPDQGEIKILDFGLAKLPGEQSLTAAGTTMGTLYYMPPEQARGDAVDHRADIWSLGVVLYQMVTGVRPFQGDHSEAVIYAILHEEPKPPKELKPEIPWELDQIIGKALKKEPESRYASVADMLHELKTFQTSLQAPPDMKITIKTMLRHIRRPRFAVPLLILFLLVTGATTWWVNHNAKIRWAKEVALPKIQELSFGQLFLNNLEAYNLSIKAEEYLKDDPLFQACMRMNSGTITIKTVPEGAKVFRRPFDQPESDWEKVGVSPIEKLFGPAFLYNWKFEKPGYETLFRQFWSEQKNEPGTYECKLDKSGSLPENMVRIPTRNIRGVGEMPAFFIDIYEVTNRQFKQFIDEGGYQNQTYWEVPIIRNGLELSWHEAMKTFQDSTGRYGPAAWEGGSYPDGKDHFPVNGVSWYEAVAYAKFVNKDLPTVWHWSSAKRRDSALLPGVIETTINQMSNFDARGPVEVGTTEFITQFGVYDMAGNVREWCWNKSEKGRTIRGGACGDAHYQYYGITHASPLDRSLKNGFRCVIYPEKEKIPEKFFTPWTFGNRKRDRDFTKETPVPDSVFNAYKDFFSYPYKDLNAVVEETIDKWPHQIYQKVTLSSAYDDDHLILHIFLPKSSSAPFQTVVYYPGSFGQRLHSSDNLYLYPEIFMKLTHYVKDGRAAVYPVLKGSFERRTGIDSKVFYDRKSIECRDYFIMLVKDIKRTIDYLETRSDIDKKRIAYHGYSAGGVMGPIILAVEHRLKIGIIDAGGLLPFNDFRPSSDPFNYVSRVYQPTLVISGRYDVVWPWDACAKPFYDLLGTPEKDKRMRIFESDHTIPRKGMIEETLNWLDKYFGPAKGSQNGPPNNF